MIQLSIIVPVYNRPDEIEELLESLTKQTEKDFEIVIVEDGSQLKCDEVVEKYSIPLNIKYFYKKNEKPSIARNYGVKRAAGNYYIFVDSDCILPPHYIETVKKELENNYVDCYGGPDKAHGSFSTVQKAINYAMTSIITTGGIRNKQKIDKYYPRSFNMGFSTDVFEKTHGFPITKMHPGEDMVLSIEIVVKDFETRLLEGAYVYHKRRTNLKQFYKQVFRFGKTRVIISKFYPSTFKIFYTFPTIFIFGLLCLGVASLFFPWLLFLPGLFVLLVFTESLFQNKNLRVALLSVITTFIQQFGYGIGFFSSFLKFYVFGIDEYNLKKQPFYPENK